MVWHFKNVFEGYLTLAIAPLPRHYLSKDIPVADQVKGAGFRVGRDRQAARSPGPFKFESVTPQAELRLVQQRQLREPAHRQARQPRLRRVQVVRRSGRDDRGLPRRRDRRRVRPPGLRHPEGPGPRRPGRGHPGPPVRVPAPELVARTDFDEAITKRRLLAQRRRSRTAARAARRPTRRSARRSPTRSTRTRSTRASSAATPRSRTPTSARRPGSTRTRPRRPSTRRRPSRSWPMAAGRTPTATASSRRTAPKAKIELCTTTRQVRQDTLALVSAWLKDVGIDSVINPVRPARHLRRLQRGDASTPRAPSRRSNFDLAEHAFSSSIDPLGNYFSYHSSQFHPHGRQRRPRQRPGHRQGARRREEQRRLRGHQGRHGRPSRRSTSTRPSRSRSTTARTSSSPARALGNYFANGTQVGSTWNGEDWFAQPVGRASHGDVNRRGARNPGAPFRTAQRGWAPGCTVRATVRAMPAGPSRSNLSHPG